MYLFCSGNVAYPNSKEIKGNHVKPGNWGGEEGERNLNRNLPVPQIHKSIASSFAQL